MSQISILNTFTAGTKIQSTPVNENFTTVKNAVNDNYLLITGLDTDKADKVSSAVSGNLAELDSSGNLVDSGESVDTIINTARLENLGTCSTASATAEKVVDISGVTLETGLTIRVKFTNANTADTPTLNFNGTVDAIYNEASVAVSANNPAYFPANSIVDFTFDGTNWIFKNRDINNYLNGTSKYTIKASGEIKQYGSVSVDTAGTYVTVNLLKSFKDTNYIVTYGLRSDVYAGGEALVRITAMTSSSFTLWNYSGTTQIVKWEATGY